MNLLFFPSRSHAVSPLPPFPRASQPQRNALRFVNLLSERSPPTGLVPSLHRLQTLPAPLERLRTQGRRRPVSPGEPSTFEPKPERSLCKCYSYTSFAHSAATVPRHKANSNPRKDASDAFSLLWRKKLQQQLREDGPSSTPVCQPAKPRKTSATDASEEEEPVVGGLCNEDIEAERDVMIKGAASGARVAGKQVRRLDGIVMTLKLTILFSLASKGSRAAMWIARTSSTICALEPLAPQSQRQRPARGTSHSAPSPTI